MAFGSENNQMGINGPNNNQPVNPARRHVPKRRVLETQATQKSQQVANPKALLAAAAAHEALYGLKGWFEPHNKPEFQKSRSLLFAANNNTRKLDYFG